MWLVVHRVVVREVVGPGRRRELDLVVRLTRLYEQAHPHRAAVRLLKAELLAKLALRLAAHTIRGTRERREDRVTRTIRENLRPHHVLLIRGQLEAGHGGKAVAVHLHLVAGTVEDQVDVRLKPGLFVEERVPDGPVARRVAVHVLKGDLLHDARLLEVAHTRSRAGDPHADLA